MIATVSLGFVLTACEGKIESSEGEMTAGESSINETNEAVNAGESNTGGASSGGGAEEETPAEMPVETPETPAEMPVETPETPTETPDEEPTGVSLDELDRAPIEDEGEGETVSLIAPEPVPVLERPRRRMNLDQLDLAIRQVTGGLFWNEVRNGEEQSLFVSLSATLGKPDFIQRTSEDLTPSALFAKFIDDAARQVCAKRIEIDLAALGDPREDSVSPDILLWGPLSPELSEGEETPAVDDQIRALVLRFHSHQLPEGDSPRLAYWRWLFETASLVDHSPLSGWKALCVALINHPDFYSY